MYSLLDENYIRNAVQGVFFFFQYISIVLVNCVIPWGYCHDPYFDVVMTNDEGGKDDQLTDMNSEKALTIDGCLWLIIHHHTSVTV